MSRSPLSYPLNRAADTDVGGAADLQTDIMRFMAILSLCLVAIFALVQSIPLAPVEPEPVEVEEDTVGATLVAIDTVPEPVESEPLPEVAPEPERAVVLTRPKWVPKYKPVASEPQVASELPPTVLPPTEAPPVASKLPPTEPEEEGFTLRFASDAALTRAVAAHHVSLYALAPGSA